MSHHVRQRQARIAQEECGECGCKTLVLAVGIWPVVRAFEFDADRIVVALFATPVARHACVPGTSIKRDELRHRAAPRDQEMARHAHARQVRQRRVNRRVQHIREQCLDHPRAELAGRQRNAVHHDK